MNKTWKLIVEYELTLTWTHGESITSDEEILEAIQDALGSDNYLGTINLGTKREAEIWTEVSSLTLSQS